MEIVPALPVKLLMHYIETCPTDLHPDCIHRVDVDNGDATCSRECEDELLTLLGLADDFDAGAIAADDFTAAGPTTDWATVSLLRFVDIETSQNRFIASDDLFSSQLSAHKSQVWLTTALNVLAGRGVPIRRLIRGCLGHRVVHGVRVAAARGYTDDRTGRVNAPPDVKLLAARLAECIPEPPAGSSETQIFRHALVRSGASSFSRKLYGWLSSSSLQSIVLWWPPSKSAEWVALGESHCQVDHEMRWLLDRLTSTYLDEWEAESLRLESQFLGGVFKPSIPSTILSERHVTVSQVARAMQHQLSHPKGQSAAFDMSVDELTHRAAELLEAGRHELASTLFEGAASASAGSAQAALRNNQGFCMLPLDPLRALAIFAEVDPDQTDPAVCYNRAVAHHVAGARLSAAEAARKCLTLDDVSGYFWVARPSGQLQLDSGFVHEFAETLLSSSAAD